MPGDRGVEPDLGLIEAEAVLAEAEFFFYGPSQPCRADQPGDREGLAFADEAVVKGQLAGLALGSGLSVINALVWSWA